MNKVFKRVGMAVLGVSIAFSITAIANNHIANPITVFAADSQAGNVYTVDLTAKNYSNQQSITTVNHSYTGVFTVTFATGNGTNDPKYYTSGTSVRTYSNNTLTIAPTKDYKITAISFTMSQGTPDSASPTGLSNDKLSWSGSSASGITFTTGSSQARYQKITVTVASAAEPDKEVINKTIVGPTDKNMVVGEDDIDISNEITIDSVIDDSCTVSSSVPSVVSVSGKTLHAVSAGESVITISKAEVETDTTITRYTSAQFTVTVTYPPIDLPDMPNGNYEKITSSSNLVDGYYLLVNEDNNVIFDGSLSDLDSQSGHEVTIDESSIETSETIDEKALYISALDGENQYSIVANIAEESPVYIGRTGNSNGLDISSEPLTNTITISEGLSTILGAGGRKLIYYSNNSNFRYYAASNNTTVSLYKKVSTEPVVDVYSENISVSKSNITVALGDSETITAQIDGAATVRDITWESNNANVTVIDGAISVLDSAVVGSTATITAKVKASDAENDYLTAQCVVTVGNAKLAGLSRTGYHAFYAGQKIADYAGGVISASWTAGDNTAIDLDDPNLSITLGGEPVTKDTVLTESDDKKQIRFTYSDPNYDGVSASTSNYAISVGKYFEIQDMVPHFANDLSYILSTSDEGESYLSFGYTSWGGKAAATVESSNADLVVASISEHSISGTKATGKIGLLTDGESKGQAVITLKLTLDEETLLTSYVVTVRNEEPVVTPGTTTYKKIAYTSAANLVAGDYIIGANTSKGYFAMSNSSFTQPIASGSITVDANNKITTENVSGYVITIGKNASNGISVSAGKNYLTFNGNNVASTTTATYLNLSQGDNGTFRIKATSDASRALCYRDGYNFRSYATSNITQGSTSYYDLELFAAETSGATYDNATVVENFINAYMQPSVLPSDKGTGSRLGENGWYKTALSHISTDLNDAQRLIFKRDYSAYYERMQAWALANSETFEIDDAGVVSNAQLLLTPVSKQETSLPMPLIIAVFAVIAAGFGSFVLVRRHKEQ